jgi:hypothetical protein
MRKLTDTSVLTELRSAVKCGAGSEQPVASVKQRGLASEALRFLLAALHDSMPYVRVEACLAFECLDDPTAIPELRRMLADRDTRSRCVGCCYFIKFGNEVRPQTNRRPPPPSRKYPANRQTDGDAVPRRRLKVAARSLSWLAFST